jgi:ribosomal protein L11 methyltransferase
VIRLAVRVRRDRAELVLAELLELAPGGVEEVAAAETVEYAVYGAPGELPTVPDLTAAVGDALVEVSSSAVADDWHERWKRFHGPVLIRARRGRAAGARREPALRVRPPWEPERAPGDVEVEEIVIEPAGAFGTGGHASTQLCLELLLELATLCPTPRPVVDVGTGSGVLAIAAARLGFAPVVGLDHDRESIDAARQNADANGVGIEVRPFELRAHTLPWLSAGEHSAGSVVVVANLLRSLLLELAATMAAAPGDLLASGLLVGEVDEIALAFGERLGLRERARRERGEWAALWLAAS